MPNESKQTADTELHSMKCTWTIARYHVETDAMPAKNIAAPMNTQYRLSNVTAESIVPDLYLMQDERGKTPASSETNQNYQQGIPELTSLTPGNISAGNLDARFNFCEQLLIDEGKSQMLLPVHKGIGSENNERLFSLCLSAIIHRYHSQCSVFPDGDIPVPRFIPESSHDILRYHAVTAHLIPIQKKGGRIYNCREWNPKCIVPLTLLVGRWCTPAGVYSLSGIALTCMWTRYNRLAHSWIIQEKMIR
jgi:hypothetical protein